MKFSTLLIVASIIASAGTAHADRILGSGSAKWIGTKRTTIERFPSDSEKAEKKCEFYQTDTDGTMVLVSLGKNIVKNDVLYLHDEQAAQEFGMQNWRYQKAQRTSCTQ